MCLRKHFFQQAAKVQVFFFVYGDNKHAVLGIEQALGNFQPPLHHGEPFAVAPCVAAVHVVVVVFPVLCASVVGRVNVNAVHFAGVEPFQQLQGVVVFRLYQGVPKAVRRAVFRGAFNRVKALQAGVNGFAKAGDAHNIVQKKAFHLAAAFAAFATLRQAPRLALVFLDYRIQRAANGIFARHGALLGNARAPKRCVFGLVVLKYQTKLFVLQQAVNFALDALAQRLVSDLVDVVLECRHVFFPFACALGAVCQSRASVGAIPCGCLCCGGHKRGRPHGAPFHILYHSHFHHRQFMPALV